MQLFIGSLRWVTVKQIPVKTQLCFSASLKRQFLRSGRKRVVVRHWMDLLLNVKVPQGGPTVQRYLSLGYVQKRQKVERTLVGQI